MGSSPTTGRITPTLDQWVEIFVNEHSRAKHLRPSTIAEQQRMLRLYLLPVLGPSTRIDAIRTPQFEQVRRLDVPHFDSCRVKVRPGVPTFWEPDQYQTLVNIAAGFGPRELAIVLLMGDCGLRTYVTRLAAAGVQPLTIRDLAGHTRLETTMRYMHLLPSAGTRAVEALQAFDLEHHRSTAAPPITGSAS